jgi:hypothetical protein
VRKNQKDAAIAAPNIKTNKIIGVKNPVVAGHRHLGTKVELSSRINNSSRATYKRREYKTILGKTRYR